MGKSDAIWAAIFAVFLFIVGLLLFQWARDEGNTKKLRAHYMKMKDEVLENWKGIKYAVKSSAETSPLQYLNASSKLFLDNPWNIWMLSHVKSGYQELWQVLSKLKSLEEEHNKSVPLFNKMAETEAANITKSFSNLAPLNDKDASDFYVRDELVHTFIEMDGKLDIVDGVTLKTLHSRSVAN